MALGLFTGMGFHITHDISFKRWFSFYQLALKENIIIWLKKIVFKLFKIIIVINFNYKEKVSWTSRSLGSGSLYKRGAFGSFPRIGDLTYSYFPNRYRFDNEVLIHKKSLEMVVKVH